ncbi:MAG TPA: DNA-binding response regulator, partial [Ruminococcaceae bacterium]|nr:DNA-binding response regulator [Oscillospiraceae bacterium]
ARMERARTLLEDGKLKNSQIAEKVGYASPHYFSYCFRHYFGMSP